VASAAGAAHRHAASGSQIPSEGPVIAGFLSVGFVWPKCNPPFHDCLNSPNPRVAGSKSPFPGTAVRDSFNSCLLVPAAQLRPGLCQFLPPHEGWAERRQAPGCSGIRWARRVTQDARERAYVTRRAGALARRPCVPQRRNARLSALHHGDFGSGFRASISGISSRSVQRSSSQPGRSAWRADFPNLPRALATSRHPRDAIPCSAFRIVSRKRPS
jgi:hypothetical protein